MCVCVCDKVMCDKVAYGKLCVTDLCAAKFIMCDKTACV